MLERQVVQERSRITVRSVVLAIPYRQVAFRKIKLNENLLTVARFGRIVADMRGNHGSIRQNLMVEDSREFRDLRRAIAKAHGDRERAIRNICRQYGVRSLDALPAPVRSAARDLLGQ